MLKCVEIMDYLVPGSQIGTVSNDANRRVNRVELYGELCIFQKDSSMPAEHGPDLFGMLFFATDGVFSYQNLYNDRSALPFALAIVQPGYGFGNHWTNFCGNDQYLANTVRQHPLGMPSYLLQGGIGNPDFYQIPYWEEYDGPMEWSHPAPCNIHVFSNSVHPTI